MRMLCTIFVVGLAVLAVFAQCASVGAPMGGPRDSLPPQVVLMEPGNRAVNFSGKRVYLEFDEYVVVRGQQEEFFTSPGMATQPTLTLRGRGIQVDIKDTLKADQTYALHFGNAIVDNNEGNPLGDFTFVFSTGATIDSMLMSGWAVDAYTRDSANKAFIYLYPDTIPLASNGDDSTLFRAPAVVARAHSDGLFVAEYLKPINYRIYALQDANGNRTYDPGVDKAGFVDSAWNPATMPGFSIRYDTLMKRLSPDPQLYLRVFNDQNGFRRQLLRPVARPVQRRIDLQFSAPWPIIDTFRLEGIDSTRIVWQSLKPTRDSLHLWLNVADSLLPDTLKGSITYHRHDSANRLVPHTQALSLVWKDLSNLNRDKNDTLPPPNPFKYQVDASQQLNPYNNIGLNFDYPLLRLDTARVSLQLVEYPEGAEGNDSLAVRTPQPFRFERDTLDMRRWKMLADWVADGQYELMIPAGVFVNMARERNDTLRASFSVLPPENFRFFDYSLGIEVATMSSRSPTPRDSSCAPSRECVPERSSCPTSTRPSRCASASSKTSTATAGGTAATCSNGCSPSAPNSSRPDPKAPTSP